ncbi:MAG: hypothetical protein V1750_07545 [Acidobacteriota bacterium]
MEIEELLAREKAAIDDALERLLPPIGDGCREPTASSARILAASSDG